MLTRAQAKARLSRLVQADKCPELDTSIGGDLDTLLDDAAVATVWASGTTYELGAVVIPTSGNRNGLKYRLVRFDGVGVASGATEPSWSTGRDATISDGNLTWQEYGDAPTELWDLKKAARAGWELKASLVVPNVDYGDQNFKLSDSQMYEHCIKQSNLYRTVGVA
jgi:hypothetical protein